MRAAETLVWPGGEHAFRLGIGELRALEKACDAGCFVVLARLLGNRPYIDDVLAPIRLGLIGAGMADKEAMQTINAALETASPYKLTVTAAEIMREAIMWGDEADKPGERQAGADTTIQTRSLTDEPGGPDTTQLGPQ